MEQTLSTPCPRCGHPADDVMGDVCGHEIHAPYVKAERARLETLTAALPVTSGAFPDALLDADTDGGDEDYAAEWANLKVTTLEELVALTKPGEQS